MARDPKHVKHGGGSVLAQTLGSGTKSPEFTDIVTADRNSSEYRAQIQPHAAKMVGQLFTVLMDNHSRHTATVTQEFLKAKK